MESRALVVGRTDDNWNVFVKQVQQHVTEVVTAEYCAAGLKIFDNDIDIDIVFIDADTPDESASKFLQAVRSDSRLQTVPVIVVGARFSEEAILNYRSLNAYDILTLPTLPATLEAKITRAMFDSRPTVLIVDDEEVIRDLIRSFVSLERFRSITAASADEAYDILLNTDHNIRVVVTDLVMPGMSGLDLLVKIKDEFPHIPVILITGHSVRYSPKQAIEAGADGYFAKPFHNKELIYTLRSVLSRHHKHGRPSVKTQAK